MIGVLTPSPTSPLCVHVIRSRVRSDGKVSLSRAKEGNTQREEHGFCRLEDSTEKGRTSLG